MNEATMDVIKKRFDNFIKEKNASIREGTCYPKISINLFEHIDIHGGGIMYYIFGAIYNDDGRIRATAARGYHWYDDIYVLDKTIECLETDSYDILDMSNLHEYFLSGICHNIHNCGKKNISIDSSLLNVVRNYLEKIDKNYQLLGSKGFWTKDLIYRYNEITKDFVIASSMIVNILLIRRNIGPWKIINADRFFDISFVTVEKE